MLFNLRRRCGRQAVIAHDGFQARRGILGIKLRRQPFGNRLQVVAGGSGFDLPPIIQIGVGGNFFETLRIVISILFYAHGNIILLFDCCRLSLKLKKIKGCENCAPH